MPDFLRLSDETSFRSAASPRCNRAYQRVVVFPFGQIPYFCAIMTTEQIKELRDRVGVLRRFL